MFYKHLLHTIIFSISIGCIACKSYHPAIVSKQDIFENQEVPFQQCHASSIHQIGQDSFIATWFGGTHESNPDVCIWTSVCENGKWTSPKKVADGSYNHKLYPTWNPVFYQHPLSDTLFLYYKIGPNPREWKGFYKYTLDKGNTWSPPHPLPQDILGPIKNKPLTLADGIVISPSSTESLDEVWKSHIEVSKDHGKTWTHIPIRHEDTVEVIQPSILEHADGVLQILCRSKQNYVMTTFSKDEGKTWQNWQTTNLKNPNAATDAIKIHNGLFMIVYNPDIAGKEWWQGRTKLYIAISKDGIRWKDVIQLENGEEGDEYSYPTIIQDSKNNIHITYTWNRKTIRHVVLK